MNILGREMPFPARSELRFDSLLEHIEKQAEKSEGPEKEYLSSILERCKVLSTEKGLTSSDLKKHKMLVQELMRIIFPVPLTHNEIKGVTAPWNIEFVYKSKRLEEIIKRAGKNFQLTFEGWNDDEMYIAACTYIMAVHYGYPSSLYRPFYFNIPNATSGKTHAYRLASNVDNIKVIPTDRSIEITKEIFHELTDNFSDVKRWKKYFPADSWILSGFGINNLMDLTADQKLVTMTRHLLSGNADINWNLSHDISEILGFPVHLSFLRLKGKEVLQNRARDIRPMLMGGRVSAVTSEFLNEDIRKVVLLDHDHLAIPDVKAYAKLHEYKAMLSLAKGGIKSYYVAALKFQDELLGLMELGSEVKGQLNSAIRIQIETLMPIIAISAKRFLDEFDNKIEAVIQSEFTAIHPSVKWRFADEAEKIVVAEQMEEEYQINNVVFGDVIPLFGQLDIRNSSVIRNEGIKNDLQAQLIGARKMLDLAYKENQMPLYEEMIHVLNMHHDQLDHDMISASEQEILQFLTSEVHPVLEHLADSSKKLKSAHKGYMNLLHPDLGIVYNERAAFDQTVNTVNKVLSKYIDAKQIGAQAMFPHHFERYATDGLEFNMYIGESIAPGKGFHPMMVKNLRLWQLIVMVEMEREYHAVKKTMETPLSVAALVLSHSTPLAIEYRMDEKQFDVEGAYNVRYEIIKKRIDKAHIKGTNERITEPGKMVVVYSTQDEEHEYLRYFSFMQSKGYIFKGTPEFLTLEDLQGVTGLKALRLDIDYQEAPEVSELTMEEIIAEIEVN